ncbi:MAG: ribose-phosphate pyrophosphokinase [Clostridia bacterium]|nr:ribose-phosphate pyrophosphokinase [Clostridia bacterium]MBQ8399730.1 ribose-phosphate pyrophosphokinase [Clostridia bacterium]
MSDAMFGDLSLIAMKGCEPFINRVDSYLKEWRGTDKSFIVKAGCPRFGSGEGKGIVFESLRGHDVFILCDVFNYGVTYTMYGKEVPMSPDDHFADLKRIIGAIGGKAKRITVIMPMLYEGRQHKRSSRESLDCAMMLQELVNMGVSNMITFDAHDARVQNAIPLHGFDNVQPTYQMIKALIRNVPDLILNADHTTIVSPDEGGMTRCMYFSSVLKLDLGMFYKRRNYAVIVNGRNPIEAHEYLGKPVEGKDVIIVDDMISSGDSIIEIGEKLKDRGAKRIFAFTSFGLFCNGLERFDAAYERGVLNKVFTTNLIYRPEELLQREWYCEVDLCKYVALLVDSLHRDETISALLDPVQKIHSFVDKCVAEGKLQV